jgi:hypothetical protein
VSPAPALVLAHLGTCTSAEAASTIGVSGELAILLFRPWRKTATVAAKLTRLTLPVVLAFTVTLTGCGGSKAKTSPTTNRPTTAARLQIVQPTANQVTGPNVTLVVNLIGARVVQPSQGTLRGDEGHIHVSVDGKLVSMTYGTSQPLPPLMPGQHIIQAEFVAIDHVPFKDRRIAAVIFTSQ